VKVERRHNVQVFFGDQANLETIYYSYNNIIMVNYLLSLLQNFCKNFSGAIDDDGVGLTGVNLAQDLHKCAPKVNNIVSK